MTEKPIAQESEKTITITFKKSDWKEVNKILKEENKKKKTRIQFRIEEQEKSEWEEFLDNNYDYESMTDLILQSVRKTISAKQIRKGLKSYNPFEERFISLWGIKKINKEIRNSVDKSENHVKEINKVVMASDIPKDLTIEMLIEKMQKNNIENLYLSAIINKKMQE